MGIVVAVAALGLVPVALAETPTLDRDAASAPEPGGAERASSPYPTMRYGEAQDISRRFLRHKFDNTYVHGYAKDMDCHRVSRKVFKCSLRWNLGDLSYKGFTRPFWSDIDRRWVYYSVGYKITRTNHYCLAVGGSRDACTQEYRGVW